jgi:hypothetical protein
MKVEKLVLGLKRDIRLAKYQVSQCSAQLSVEIEEGDDLTTAKEAVHETLIDIVEDMIEQEKVNYREKLLDASKN